jgi:hypothetical protein
MIDYLTEIPKIGIDSTKTGPFKDPRLVIWKSPNDPWKTIIVGENARQKVLSEVRKHRGLGISAFGQYLSAKLSGTRPNFRPTSGSMLVRRGLRDAEGSAKKSGNFCSSRIGTRTMS